MGQEGRKAPAPPWTPQCPVPLPPTRPGHGLRVRAGGAACSGLCRGWGAANRNALALLGPWGGALAGRTTGGGRGRGGEQGLPQLDSSAWTGGSLEFLSCLRCGASARPRPTHNTQGLCSSASGELSPETDRGSLTSPWATWKNRLVPEARGELRNKRALVLV